MGLNLQINLVLLVLLNYWKFSQYFFSYTENKNSLMFLDKCEKVITQLQEVESGLEI